MSINIYDQVSYSHLPTGETHPDRMAVLGRLRGLNPPPVDGARVLDLGANEGGCLIPMALSLPHSGITGIDLAAGPVERGNAIIHDLGLSNARLIAMDLLDVDPSFGEFDYIIAHGLYAWTPQAVRDKVLAIARANLSPNGIALMSYNTYPGGHVRQLLREMMLFHAAGVEDPGMRIRQARAILSLMTEANPEATGIAKTIAQEAERALARRDASILHDYMSDAYQPVYFRDFVAHAARHGLAYVDDASVIDTRTVPLTPQVQETVRQIAAGDRILQEQYFDLLRVRLFRCSLLCHAEAAPQPEWINARAVGMFAASSARETAAGHFVTTAGLSMETETEMVIDLLRRSGACWPQPVAVGPEEADLALALFQLGLIDLRSIRGVATRAGERPLASPLARRQVQESPVVATLLHTALDIRDPRARRFLTLLDGTRDRLTLAAEAGCGPEQVQHELEQAASHGLLLA